MRMANVGTIFRRELKDQLRDRRTLFMIFVLPMLLYPILGIGIAQLTAAFAERPRTVVVVGAEHLPESPPLLNEARDGFAPGLFPRPGDAATLRVAVAEPGSAWADPNRRPGLIRAGAADAAMIVPEDVGEQLRGEGQVTIPVVYESTDESSQATALRVERVLRRWEEADLARRLARDAKPETYAEPVRPVLTDVAPPAKVGGNVWARLFPFLLVMMALTGAFYPAVDLCAGEKERGTMETLLISPASRAEIVLGKFLTVMMASMGTALLNLLSMGLTGWHLAGRLGGAGSGVGGDRAAAMLRPPSLESAAWMLLLLVPLSAFFSALCLALAVLARSMKEGQYYMTPLYLVAMPLVFATLAPGVELDLFTSLVPITGVSLLLRALMRGDYADARQFFLPVLIPLVVYGAIALRWAIDQFRRESVLFREAERISLRDYLRHLIRDRGPIPTGGEALFCFALMLTSAWFLGQLVRPTPAWLVGSQLGYVLAPPVVLTLLLTSRPGRTLRLRRPSWRYLALGVGLALALHPLAIELRPWVEALFPIPEAIEARLEALLGQFDNVWTALLAVALVPAVCEEVAFRGFILSGLEHAYRRRTAIILSAFLFGFLHVLLSLFQQLFNATLLGLVLGLLAVKSRSLWPGVVFHFLNNALALVVGAAASGALGGRIVEALYRDPAQGLYHPHWVALAALVSAVLLGSLAMSPEPGPEAGVEAVRDPVAFVP